MTTDDMIARLIARLGPPQEGPPPLGPCGFAPWEVGAPADAVERCQGGAHYRGRDLLRRCPAVTASEVAADLAAERDRLAGPIARLGCVPTWDGYRPGEVIGGAAALRALAHFARVRAPERSVYLSGSVGTGKTRLLLTCHFARLASGFPSQYRTAGELRPLFRALASFDEAAQREARNHVANLARAPVLMLDDLGDVTGSPAFHQDFAAGLKLLLDQHSGRLVVANNLDHVASQTHPDLGPRVVSRLLEGADAVRLRGADQRLASARAAT